MFLLFWKSETGQESPNDILQGVFFLSNGFFLGGGGGVDRYSCNMYLSVAYQYKLFLNYKTYTIDNRQYFICTNTFTINGYGIN